MQLCTFSIFRNFGLPMGAWSIKALCKSLHDCLGQGQPSVELLSKQKRLGHTKTGRISAVSRSSHSNSPAGAATRTSSSRTGSLPSISLCDLPRAFATASRVPAKPSRFCRACLRLGRCPHQHVLWLACRHRVLELVVRAAWTAAF